MPFILKIIFLDVELLDSHFFQGINKKVQFFGGSKYIGRNSASVNPWPIYRYRPNIVFFKQGIGHVLRVHFIDTYIGNGTVPI